MRGDGYSPFACLQDRLRRFGFRMRHSATTAKATIPIAPNTNIRPAIALLVSTIETHHDLWIILETLALVFFTGTLWWSTRQLQMTMLGTPKLVRA
jgi:hypothetical protein